VNKNVISLVEGCTLVLRWEWSDTDEMGFGIL
jgi:hypothetical protein